MIGRYRVSGRRAYRGHEQGSEFIARLERGVEQRALMRGAIELLGYIEPSIEPGRLRFPEGWLDQPQSDQRAAGAALVI